MDIGPCHEVRTCATLSKSGKALAHCRRRATEPTARRVGHEMRRMEWTHLVGMDDSLSFSSYGYCEIFRGEDKRRMIDDRATLGLGSTGFGDNIAWVFEYSLARFYSNRPNAHEKK